MNGDQLAKYLDQYDGEHISLKAEFPQEYTRFDGGENESNVYILCNAVVPSEHLRAPLKRISYPLSPRYDSGTDELECGEPWLNVDFNQQNKLLENVYPTLVSYFFSGTFRIQSSADYINGELRKVYTLIPVSDTIQ